MGIHGSHLMLYARQLCRCEADAEDVVQNALVKTWRHLVDIDDATRDDPESHRGLLFTNIRRCAIDLGRSLQRRQKGKRALAAEQSSEGPGLQVSWFELPPDDEVRQLQAALTAVPMKFREVITLKIWAGLTFAQIGETLGISPNTAASRYRYGLETLRNRLSSSVPHRPPGDGDG